MRSRAASLPSCVLPLHALFAPARFGIGMAAPHFGQSISGDSVG